MIELTKEEAQIVSAMYNLINSMPTCWEDLIGDYSPPDFDADDMPDDWIKEFDSLSQAKCEWIYAKEEEWWDNHAFTTLEAKIKSVEAL